MNKYIVGLMFLLSVGCSHKESVTFMPGPQGDAGATGATGAAGANGHSLVSQTVEAGYCECDQAGGNRLDIYLDNDDSLSVSEGDSFQSALIACNGRNGLNGSNGLPGTTGATGETGSTGETGATGAQGIPGAQGPSGSQGTPGPMGMMGPQGAMGSPGPTGSTGPQGPQGTPGAQGPAGSGATLQNYTLNSSCQSVSDGYYAKKSGSDVKLYSNSSCSSLVTTVYAEHVSNGDASYWLTSTRLGFNDNSGNLRVIKFN